MALVARNGDPLTGTVTRRLKFVDQGGRTSVTLERPHRYDRITGVIVNADARVRGFTGGDWVYSKDGSRFHARLIG